MRLQLLLLGVLAASSTCMKAEVHFDMEPIKLEVPEMKPELVRSMATPLTYYEQRTLLVPETAAAPEPKMDLDFFKQKTNPGVKPYDFMDDVTFVGVPIFAAGWIIKGEKRGFQSSDRFANTKTKLITDFKTSIDDYTQFFGPVMTVGLKVGGYEGRSDWPRLVTSSLISYGIMAGFVNGIKYTAKEMRPDGSTANSWPSGHTATSFVGATILHKEYGLTRSPWFSVAGYGVATATGVMRILNNRHWISDVLSGAGIGIMSTELGYFLGDLIFKEKGLLRNDLPDSSFESPSFFAISTGLSWGLKDISFTNADMAHAEDISSMEDSESFNVNFHTASVVDAEGAYFLNKYVGVGGRLRVRTMTAKSWSDFIEDAKGGRKLMGEGLIDMIGNYSYLSPTYLQKEAETMTTLEEYTIASDHLTEFSASVGLYFNMPLGNGFSLGTKALIGRSMTQALEIGAHYQGDVKDIAYQISITDGYEPGNGLNLDGSDIVNSSQLLFDDFKSSGNSYDVSWDYLTLGGSNSTNYSTGLSLTYKYKANFSWRVFADYDYSRKDYTLTIDPYRFLKLTTPQLSSIYEMMGVSLAPVEYKKTKHLNYFTIGTSFMVTF